MAKHNECKHYRTGKGLAGVVGEGNCEAHPPTVLMIQGQGIGFIYPRVRGEDEGCGEWKSEEEVEA